MFYRIIIHETGRSHTRDKASLFNVHEAICYNKQEIEEFFIDRYGRVPNQRSKVYIDKKDGTTQEIGFTYSYWNQDLSHMSEKWFQTDWIEIRRVGESSILLKNL